MLPPAKGPVLLGMAAKAPFLAAISTLTKKLRVFPLFLAVFSLRSIIVFAIVPCGSGKRAQKQG
jgi:hypothetical protein